MHSEFDNLNELDFSDDFEGKACEFSIVLEILAIASSNLIKQ